MNVRGLHMGKMMMLHVYEQDGGRLRYRFVKSFCTAKARLPSSARLESLTRDTIRHKTALICKGTNCHTLARWAGQKDLVGMVIDKIRRLTLAANISPSLPPKVLKASLPLSMAPTFRGGPGPQQGPDFPLRLHNKRLFVACQSMWPYWQCTGRSECSAKPVMVLEYSCHATRAL